MQPPGTSYAVQNVQGQQCRARKMGSFQTKCTRYLVCRSYTSYVPVPSQNGHWKI